MYVSQQTKHEYCIRIILLAYDVSKSVVIHFDEAVLYYHLYLKVEKDYPVVA